MRDFRQLDIWKQSLQYCILVYRTTDTYPSSEKFGMVPQMNRCAISIPSNIAEGCSRRTVIDFSRFLDISLGSSFELETQIEISHQLGYISHENYLDMHKELHILQKRINKFRISL